MGLEFSIQFNLINETSFLNIFIVFLSSFNKLVEFYLLSLIIKRQNIFYLNVFKLIY
jgi:hypothetical protein